jgi:hypothetical protein
MKLKKGSAAAKAYMAKIRAKRKGVKKVGEVAKTKTGKPAKRFSKSQREFNEMVDNYKYFVVFENKVVEGNEYKNDAIDAANEYYPKAKVYTKSQLKNLGIENNLSRNKYTLGATKKVGSTLKLKANEKRLGATPADLQANGYHKDTKSHNVRINVLSGTKKVTQKLEDSLEWIKFYNEQLTWWKNYKPQNIYERKGKTDSIKFYTKSLSNEKKHLALIKKTI